MEPLTLEYVAKILRFERPDAILPGLGGQTGLNLAMQLSRKASWTSARWRFWAPASTPSRWPKTARSSRSSARAWASRVPLPIANTLSEGMAAALEIGYPVVLRPAFTLGGTGGGFADDESELVPSWKTPSGFPRAPGAGEKSIKGYKEIEYEVMRDRNDTAITVCNMENVDPVGVHTGDSVVVCPSQTLTNKEYHMLRDSALRIIRALKIEGGCNVQFALDPFSFQYYVIEVNPRVSRSSALASKASGYPIARVSAKVAVGCCSTRFSWPTPPPASSRRWITWSPRSPASPLTSSRAPATCCPRR
jgi:carbamoyl-phosphate synthase large subunit